MTGDDFKAILEPLVLAMRAEFDLPTWLAYYRALEDVPAALLHASVEAMLKEPREFFPKAGELRAMAERQRRMLLAAHPYDGCCECEHSRGWRGVLVDGVAKVQRCPCGERHKAKLTGMGLLTPVVALPGEEGARDEAVYPTMAQLPADVRARLGEVAKQKVLR